MNATLAQPQTTTDAPHGTQALSPTLSAYMQGFDACMAGESFEAAKAHGGDFLSGWWAGISAEAGMNTPITENA